MKTYDDVQKVAATNGYGAKHEDVANVTEQPTVAADKVAQLSALSTLDYAQKREAAAAELGVPLKFLDKAVVEVQVTSSTGSGGQGSEIVFPDILPADEPVDGHALLTTLLTIIKRYLVLPADAPLTIALWIIRSIAHDLFEINPRLAVRSPEKQCGKTTLLEFLSLIIPKPLLSSNCTPSSLFRIIEKCQPTLLIDEMDSFQDSHEELRGILNSGHTRSAARVIRNVGDQHEPRVFSTWCPMVCAAIGKLPDTLEDRSLRIDLQRKKKTAKVQRFPRKGPALKNLQDELKALQQQCARWVVDHQNTLVKKDPSALPELSDRANDNWSPLLSIAESLGGDWPEKARATAVVISGASAESDTIGVLLLIDIKSIFAVTPQDRLSSQALCDALEGLDERPWSTWRKGKPISTNQLARMLSNFGISSQTIRLDEQTTLKGYHETHFTEAWERYCVPRSESPDSKRDNVTTGMNTGQTPVFQNATKEACDVSENGTLANTGASCDAVTFENPKSSEAHATPVEFITDQEELHLDV